MGDFLAMFLLSSAGLFLILLVLVQRGRGGGLAGVLGGSGGSSAFGAKAGDVFTRITIVTAAIWIILCAGLLAYYSRNPDNVQVGADSQTNSPADPGGELSAPPSSDDAENSAADDSSGDQSGESDS